MWEAADSFNNCQWSMKVMFLNEIAQIHTNNRMYTLGARKQYM